MFDGSESSADGAVNRGRVDGCGRGDDAGVVADFASEATRLGCFCCLAAGVPRSSSMEDTSGTLTGFAGVDTPSLAAIIDTSAMYPSASSSTGSPNTVFFPARPSMPFMYVLLLFRFAVDVGTGRDWTTAVVVIVNAAGAVVVASDSKEAAEPVFPCCSC